MNETINSSEIKVIVFQLNKEEYGVEVEHIRSIERMLPITRVPKISPFIKGVINLRGVVIPIIDLRSRFKLENKETTDETRIIIVMVNNIEVGLIVDEANDVVDIPRKSIEPPPRVIGSIPAEYVRGVAKNEKRLLILLHLDKLINPEKTIEENLQSSIK